MLGTFIVHWVILLSVGLRFPHSSQLGGKEFAILSGWNSFPPPLDPLLTMRIALLVDPLTLASRGGRHAPGLAEALIARGHEVRGFGAPPGVVPSSVDYKELHGLSRFGADALVAYDGLSPTAFSAARVAKRSGAQLILVEPGLAGRGAPLHERFLQGVGERLWGHYVRGAATQVVALDPVAQLQAVEEGFAAERVVMLPAGLNLTKWNPANARAARTRHGLRGRVVLYAGPLETSIGLEPMIRAFARTVGQHPDWSLALLGKGAGRRSLQIQAKRLGVSSSVHWLDQADETDVPALFAAATLFVAPAVDDGPQCGWLMRAMASGLPVLASDIPRFSWIVKDGEHGLVLPPSEDLAWESALTRAASGPVARARWAQNARGWAETNLDWSRIAQIFESMCAAAPLEDDAA